jgi:hypothetical protein
MMKFSGRGGKLHLPAGKKNPQRKEGGFAVVESHAENPKQNVAGTPVNHEAIVFSRACILKACGIWVGFFWVCFRLLFSTQTHRFHIFEEFPGFSTAQKKNGTDHWE